MVGPSAGKFGYAGYMRTPLALILVAVGAIVMFYGGGTAVKELMGLYSSTLNDPMRETDGGAEGVRDRMLEGVIIGGVGAVPFVAGTLMLRITILQRLLRGRK